MAKRIGLVLSGCGVFDGSEIHEAVFSLLHLRKHGYEVVCLAPDIPQHHVINHLTGEESPEKRNVLVESARIARGKIRDLATARAAEFDGLFFPGGFGAAKNLSTFALQGASATVDPEVRRIIREMHDAKKPLGFLCISPTLAALVIGNGVEVTIGNDPGTAGAIETAGGRHINKAVDQAYVDQIHRVVTAPAYMYDADITEVERAAAACVDAFAKLVG